MTEIIPAIDLIEGCCVRLTQGDYAEKTVYGPTPCEMARQFEAAGARTLHLVDLDGAKASHPCNLQVLRDICATTNIAVEWGGGIKNGDSIKAVLDAGAARVVCGSVAVAQPQLFAGWLSLYGGDRVVLGADVRGCLVATHGWLKTSEFTVHDLMERFISDGLTQAVCTDISRDGTLQGPQWSLYEELKTAFPQLTVTVSGGVGGMCDVEEAARRSLPRVIVGKAFYEGKITINELRQWWQNE